MIPFQPDPAWYARHWYAEMPPRRDRSRRLAAALRAWWRRVAASPPRLSLPPLVEGRGLRVTTTLHLVD